MTESGALTWLHRAVAVVAALLMFTAIANVVAPPRVCACSCVPVEKSPKEIVRSFDAVFVGVPAGQTRQGDRDLYEIDVSQVYTGSVGSTTTIGTDSEGPLCGASLTLGEKRLFAVSTSTLKSEKFQTNMCSDFMLKSFDAEAVAEEAYGAPRPPDPAAPTASIPSDNTVARVVAIVAGAAATSRDRWRRSGALGLTGGRGGAVHGGVIPAAKGRPSVGPPLQPGRVED